MNVSEMTCEQVNEAIARLRESPGTIRLIPRAGGLLPNLYDYCHDWAAAGPLLEEMTRVHQVRLNFDPQYISDKAYDQWLDGPAGADYPSAPRFYLPDLMLFYDGDMGDPPAGDVLPEAIARAYHAWRTEADA